MKIRPRALSGSRITVRALGSRGLRENATWAGRFRRWASSPRNRWPPLVTGLVALRARIRRCRWPTRETIELTSKRHPLSKSDTLAAQRGAAGWATVLSALSNPRSRIFQTIVPSVQEVVVAGREAGERDPVGRSR